MIKNESVDIINICEEICTKDNKHYEFIISIKPNPRNYKGMDSVDISVLEGESLECSVNGSSIEEALNKMQKAMNKPKIIVHQGKRYIVVEEIQEETIPVLKS